MKLMTKREYNWQWRYREAKASTARKSAKVSRGGKRGMSKARRATAKRLITSIDLFI